MAELFTETIIELYKNPPNKGKIDNPDITASGGNPTCGDQITIYIKTKNQTIEEIKFQPKGCAISTASTALLTEMAKGKKIEEAMQITPENLFEKLGNIIQTRQKCALLGLIILKAGISEYLKNKNKKTETKITI
jgi:nitrogen fixation NifU-like protein